MSHSEGNIRHGFIINPQKNEKNNIVCNYINVMFRNRTTDLS